MQKGKLSGRTDLEEALLKVFLSSISILRRDGKLGVLLLQLSPAFSPHKHELGELKPLISMLGDYRLAIEFRNRNWVAGDQRKSTVDFLRGHRTAFVNVDTPAGDQFTIMPSNLNEITNPSVTYLRLHGRNARAYLTGKTVAARFDYNYSDNEIAEVAERTRRLARKAREVHVIFNNNNLDYAPRAAERLRVALGQIAAAPPTPQTPELF